MPLTTYTELKASIIGHLNRDDLAITVDDFIDLAEARHKREVRIRDLLVSASFTLAADASSVALPADFNDHKYLRVEVPDATAGAKYLRDVTELTLHELTLVTTMSKRPPFHYTVSDAIYFDAVADQAYDGDQFYYKLPIALSDAQESNEILALAPDLYLYGALLAAEPYLMNDPRIQTWSTLYGDALNSTNASQRDAKRGGPLVSRVHGVGSPWR